ncbi:MAG: D-2-hydroxyacid dehydrogenase [Clostridia bacterium]|nr:D-2-hydroxyacid dehydrogenase [Clostridia bacterium]
MNIVILDGYTENPGDLSWDALAELGTLTVYDRTPKETEEIIRRIGDAEIVFTNKTPLTAEIFDRCPAIRYVGLLSTGYNIADIDAARRHGIPVTNIPAYGTTAVAQAAMALLLEITNRVGHHAEAVRQGRWSACDDFCFWDHPLMELSGRTLGIVGFGRIGQAFGKAARAFGMEILAAGSRPTEEGRAIAEYVSLDELYARADVISLHCPLFPETERMINKNTIAKMKDGVILLNTGRGQLICEPALAEALHSGKIRAAGLDVLSQEPPAADNPLLTAPNCFITPHIAWAAKESRQRLMDTAVDNLKQFLNGTPVNVVNP